MRALRLLFILLVTLLVAATTTAQTKPRDINIGL